MTHRIVPARPAHAEAIASLAIEGFDAELRKFFVYAMPGAGAFIRSQLEVPSDIAERLYLVALDQFDEIVGMIDVVRSGKVLHLAYIAVKSNLQGQGLASRLLSEAVERAALGFDTMELDVFSENEAAGAWYEKLGFAPLSRSQWWFAEALHVGDVSGATVNGVPAADAVHERFGFSEIGVQSGTNRYRVGRLGGTWYRITDASILDDPHALGALRALHGGRSFLLIADDQFHLDAPWMPIARATRMAMPLAPLRERIADRALLGKGQA